jgi:dCMP deaminase
VLPDMRAPGDKGGVVCAPCLRLIDDVRLGPERIRAVLGYLDRIGDRSWDGYFLRFAALAATRSKDPSSGVGAVLVRDNQVLATGYNGNARGVRDDVPERLERPEKYNWVVHAEENAILSAARHGVSTFGASLYVTPLFPCGRCASSIVNAGIVEVVSSDSKQDNPRWRAEFERAMQMFNEAGVRVRSPEEKA